MSHELPRFDQRFIQQVAPDSVEHQFISSVGDVTYLRFAHRMKIMDIHSEVNWARTTNSSEITVDSILNPVSYSDFCEHKFIDAGLEEMIFSLNSLKVAADKLKGRNILWTESDLRNKDEDERWDDYIVDSRVGFDPSAPSFPVMHLTLSKDSGSLRGINTPIGEMWDIAIPLK